MVTVLDPWFWVMLGTLTVLGAATAVGLTAALERLVDRLQERRDRDAPRRAGAPRRPDARAAVRRHRRRAGHGGGAHAH